jgi:hypothetical protein
MRCLAVCGIQGYLCANAMKTLACLPIILALLLGFATTTHAAQKAQTSAGVEAAKTLSTVTGVAISPLLGVGAVGAYEWWQAPAAQRPKLHWYAQPYFWIPALLLVALVAAKDIFGTAAPTALKKPFDVAEALENKVSGMVAAGTFIPFMVTIFPKATEQTSAVLSQAGFAAITLPDIGNWLLVPFAIAIFLVVWLASHAINILILISPFTTVDAALKSLRMSVLGLVTMTAWVNPWVGALFSALIVLFAWMISGWAFRLLVLGSVFSWDFFTFRRHRFLPVANGNWMFAARARGDMPIRTYGRLFSDLSGKRTFEYRPWLVLPKKTMELPAGDYAVGEGLFYPEIMRVEGEEEKTLFILPPRYRGHEADIAKACVLTDIRDVGLRKGIKSIGRAMKSLFGVGQSRPALPAPA